MNEKHELRLRCLALAVDFVAKVEGQQPSVAAAQRALTVASDLEAHVLRDEGGAL